MAFRDRADAGRRLAARLGDGELQDPIVLALPRGGVPVGAEVASALGAPLEVLVVRKIGMPGEEELAVGAVAEGMETPVLTGAAAHVPGPELSWLAARARCEVARRAERYRGGRPLPEMAGRDAVVVDDGLATGATAKAALRAARNAGPRAVVLAVPVCAPQTAAELRPLADDVVCVISPEKLLAVGAWYDAFDQVGEDEVLALLGAHRRPGGEAAGP